MFWKLVKESILQKFFKSVFLEPLYCNRIMIVSPWITPMADQDCSLVKVLGRLPKNGWFTIVTRTPEFSSHKEAICILSKHPKTEIIFNDSIHAKLYVAVFGRDEKKIGLIGSANMTARGNTQGEVGIIFFYSGEGKRIVEELEREVNSIRQLPQGRRVKRRGESVSLFDAH